MSGALIAEKQRRADARDNTPWKAKVFREWQIVGMNHYHDGGGRKLYVAMAKRGNCIKEEGYDNGDLWKRLEDKAHEANQEFE